MTNNDPRDPAQPPTKRLTLYETAARRTIRTHGRLGCLCCGQPIEAFDLGRFIADDIPLVCDRCHDTLATIGRD